MSAPREEDVEALRARAHSYIDSEFEPCWNDVEDLLNEYHDLVEAQREALETIRNRYSEETVAGRVARAALSAGAGHKTNQREEYATETRDSRGRVIGSAGAEQEGEKHEIEDYLEPDELR